MKKVLLLFPAVLLASTAHAQTNVLKVDIIQPLINTIALSFEHKLSESSSFQLSVAGTFGYENSGNFGFYNSSGGYYSGQASTSGFSITPEYRFYLSEKHAAPEGFYVAPYVRFQNLSTTIDYNSGISYPNPTRSQSYEANLNAFGLGVVVGKHWIFKKQFSIDLFVGPGYTFTDTSSNQQDYKPNKRNFVGQLGTDNNYDFRSGASFGIAF